MFPEAGGKGPSFFKQVCGISQYSTTTTIPTQIENLGFAKYPYIFLI